MIREPCLQHGKKILRRLPVDQEFEKIDYKAYGGAVCDVPGGIRKDRQSVLFEDPPYNRLHIAFIICYQLYLAHPVSEIPDEMPYICGRAFSLIIWIGSANYREVFRHEILVLCFFSRTQHILPEGPLQALYSFAPFHLIRGRYLLTADVYVVICTKLYQ